MGLDVSYTDDLANPTIQVYKQMHRMFISSIIRGSVHKYGNRNIMVGQNCERT